MKTIGYVCLSNPYTDRKAWSGTNYKLREAIELAGYKVIWIPYKPNRRKVWLLSHFVRLFNRKSIQYGVYPSYLKDCAKSIDLNLVKQCDILFFPGMASIMKYVKVDKPFIYFSDATVHDMLDYYWFDVDRLTRFFAERQERWAIENCAIKISSSSWAANTAEKYYGCNKSKNYVILFGANIDDKYIEYNSERDSKQICLLFSGVEWERKGAAIALETIKELNRRGISAKLFMCGLKEVPDEFLPLPDYVEFLGFLNKNNSEQYSLYVDTIKRSTALLLPTKAECSGIVFCESAAFGLPVFTHDTGGLADYVVNGLNGYRLPLGSTGKDFADKIQACYENQEFCKLANNAKEYYNNNLNWKTWSLSFKKVVDSFLCI